jgi:predicted ATPase with chaperone activity
MARIKSCETTELNANQRQVNPRFGAGLGALIVTHEPAMAHEPAKGALDAASAAGAIGTSNPVLPSPLARRSAMGKASGMERVHPVKGIVPTALRTLNETKVGVPVPAENAAEADVVDGLQVIPVWNLPEAASFLKDKITPSGVDVRKSLINHTTMTWISPTSKATKSRPKGLKLTRSSARQLEQ